MGIVTFAVASSPGRHGALHHLTGIQSFLNAPAFRSTRVLHRDETVSGEVSLALRAPAFVSNVGNNFGVWIVGKVIRFLPRRALTAWLFNAWFTALP